MEMPEDGVSRMFYLWQSEAFYAQLFETWYQHGYLRMGSPLWVEWGTRDFAERIDKSAKALAKELSIDVPRNAGDHNEGASRYAKCTGHRLYNLVQAFLER